MKTHGDQMTASLYPQSKTGKHGERALDGILRFYFHENYVKCEYNAPHDFILFGRTIELKTARPQFKGKIPFWKFNLHRHGRMSNVRPDFYVLRMEKIPYMHNRAIHLLMSGNVPMFTKIVTIRSLMNGEFELAQRFKKMRNLEGEFAAWKDI